MIISNAKADQGAARVRSGVGEYARPERPWVESEALPAYLDRIDAEPVTRNFCTTLAETGVAVIDLGDPGRALCDRAVAETELYFNAGDVGRVQDAWLRSPAVRKLAAFPKIVNMLSLAYGRRAFPFQTLNFQRGTEQAVHCDTIHFHSEPERFMCGVWIALEDIAPASGPLEYVLGSHRLPVLTMQGAGVNQPEPTHQDYQRHYLPALQRRLETAGLPHATATLKKGEALVWAANLAHGGSPIADPAATRRSLVTHFYFEGCFYYTPMMSDPARQRYQTRLPMNVHTGGWVWPRREGRRAPVPLSALAEVGRRLLLRRPHVHHLNS